MALRVKRTIAELLADVPSYAREMETIRLEIRRLPHFPGVLADIIASYTTAEWYDCLMRVWKMASTNVTAYNHLITWFRHGYHVGQNPFVNNTLQALGLGDWAMKLASASQSDLAPAIACRVDIVNAYDLSIDVYKMDTRVLDAIHVYLQAIEMVARS